MVNWQVTATTIYCDAIDSDVTLMVFKDGSGRCIGFQQFGNPNKDTARMLQEKGGKLGRKLACEGPECRRVIDYRDKLFDEEKSQ